MAGEYSFSETLAALERGEHGYRVTPSDNWYQGRTIFGGLMAALSVSATRNQFSDLPPLRCCQILYCGQSSGELTVAPVLLNRAKSTAYVEVSIRSAGVLSMRAMLTFGSARPSAYRRSQLTVPHVIAPQSPGQLFDPLVAPRSTANFEGSLAGGQMPFTGSDDAQMLAWIRHRDKQAPPCEASIVALADVPPPAIFPMFDRPSPISTISWTLDLLGDGFEPAEWHLARSLCDHVSEGYCAQSMALWNVRGEAVAVGRQLVALYV